jgi:hypothetical protein
VNEIWNTNVWYNTGELWKHFAKETKPDTQATYCTIAFIWNIQNKQIQRLKNRLVVASVWGREEWGLTCKGCGVSFWANENVLELDVVIVGLYEHTNSLWIVHFIMACELCLNKK